MNKENNNSCFFDWCVLENESKIVLELGMNCLHCDVNCFFVCYIFELRVINRFVDLLCSGLVFTVITCAPPSPTSECIRKVQLENLLLWNHS